MHVQMYKLYCSHTNKINEKNAQIWEGILSYKYYYNFILWYAVDYTFITLFILYMFFVK